MDKQVGNTDRTASPAVLRASAVLEVLRHQPQGVSLSTLSRALKEAKSSLYTVLNALESAGFVSKDSVTKHYTLGPQLLVLGAAYARQSSLLTEFPAVAQLLVERLGETVQLGVLQGRHVLYVGKREGTQFVRLASEVGTLIPAHATSLGKCLLSALPDERLTKLLSGVTLEQLTPRTISTLAELQLELDQVRQRGYALDRGETLSEVRCVGAPIRDATGATVAAISVSVPITRVNDQREAELIAAVQSGARELSHRLGYSDWDGDGHDRRELPSRSGGEVGARRRERR